MPKKNYSEKEVAQIFKRAAELESKQSDDIEHLDGGRGLSLDELSQIAIDAGLDPENVRRAAGELSPSSQDSSNTVTVQSNEVIAEQAVTGDFNEELANLVISELNHRYDTTHEKPNWKDNILNDATVDPDRQSIVQRTGNNLEWKKLNKHGSEDVRVLIQPRGDQIKIRVTRKNAFGKNFADTNSITGFLPYIPYLVGVLVLFAFPANFIISALFAVLTFFILKIVLSKSSGRIEKKLSDSKNTTLEKYRIEVQSVARDLANLIGQPSSASSAKENTDSIETRKEIETDDRESHVSESNKTRKRDRS